MAEFHVSIRGLELDEAVGRSINDEIQKVVLRHLADIDLTTEADPRGLVAFRPRPGWRGLIAEVVSLNQIGNIANLRPEFDG
jgi:hypothetical protein